MTAVKVCCGQVVGVLITDSAGRLLLIERANPAYGMAPVAGHVGGHGSVDAAARAEVAEEVGLTVTALREVTGGWRSVPCGSRDIPGPGGMGHHWSVFAADVTGEIRRSVDETRGVGWFTPAEVQALAERTVAWAYGTVSDAEFEAEPGIEPVWVRWLVDAGVVAVSTVELRKIEEAASR